MTLLNWSRFSDHRFPQYGFLGFSLHKKWNCAIIKTKLKSRKDMNFEEIIKKAISFIALNNCSILNYMDDMGQHSIDGEHHYNFQ